MIRIGTAGWQIPRVLADRFPADGSTLQRYAARFTAVEINSAFYRPHRVATWERWAASTPDGFLFSVKVPKTITHERRLNGCTDLLAAFLTQLQPLGRKLGPLLVQLPPSLKFDGETAAEFFAGLRRLHSGPVACEPRHPSWFEGEAEQVLAQARIARAAADPAVVPAAARPGGWRGLSYWRLHGSPRLYYTPYSNEFLRGLATDLRTGRDAWCIFDNTMSGAAAANALDLREMI